MAGDGENGNNENNRAPAQAGSGSSAAGGGGGGRGGSNGRSKANNNNRGAPKRGTVVNREGASAMRREDRTRPLQNHKVDMKKYDKMISAAQNNFSDIIATGSAMEECTICCKQSDLFGIGSCRHPVCVECAIRMRILDEQQTCPVCRGNIDILYFVFSYSGLATVDLNFPPSKHPDEERFQIRFQVQSAGIRYEKYLAHVCKLCKLEDGERLEFANFMALRQHMAQMHQLSYCHICTDNLTLFSRERKTYTREQLACHIRSGDPDDRSQKGHPSCLFCDERFFDEEQRYRHLRKEHYYCQFCEASGVATNVFYGEHKELIAHYSELHYVCDVQACKQMGIAFSNQLDLKIHNSKEHGGSRQGLALDFQFSDRQLGGRGGGGGRDRGEGREGGDRGGLTRGSLSGRRGGRTANEPPPPLPPPGPRGVGLVAQEPVRQQQNPSDFVVIPSAQYRGPIRFQRGPAYSVGENHAEFPSLGGGTSSTAPAAPPASAFPQLGGNGTGRGGKVPSGRRPEPPQEAFPSLGGAPAPSAGPRVAGEWSRHTGDFDLIDEDERVGSSSRGGGSASARQTVPTGFVTQHSGSSSARPSKKKAVKLETTMAGPEDFPGLPTPAAANNPHMNKGFSWANKPKLTGSAITGVMVPSGYTAPANRSSAARLAAANSLITYEREQQPNKKKNKKAKEEVVMPRAPPTPPLVEETEEPEWEDVPVNTINHKGKWVKKVEKLAIVDAVIPEGYVGLSRKRQESSSDELYSEDERERREQSTSKKNGPQTMADIGKMISSGDNNKQKKGKETNNKKGEQKKKENNQQQLKKQNQNNTTATTTKTKSAERKDDFPSLGGSSNTTQQSTAATGGSILGGLFSFTGMLSNLTSGWSSTGSPATTPDTPMGGGGVTATKSPLSPVTASPRPPALSSPVSSSVASSLSMGPPPGFEGMVPKAPMSNPVAPPAQPSGIFTSAPMLSEKDIREAKEAINVKKEDPEGWEQIPKKVAPKKNNKKK